MIDITDESYESDLSEEESNELLLMCGHAIGPQLSSAAQKVLDAFRTSHTGQGCLAAALRAAVDQAAPGKQIENIDYVHQHYTDGWKDALHVILAIANELEGIK